MSGPTDLGQTYRYRHTITDANGTPTNAGALPGGVIITITLPDGTVATPTVSNAGAGLYDIAYLTTMAGKHDLSGRATGGVLGTEFDVWEDVFTVETPLRMFIGVDEAASHLRASGVITSSADREQLRWLCMVGSSVVEDDLSRVIARRTVTETYDGACFAIVLRSTPVISIVSVVENGITLTSNDYTLNPTTGILRRGSTVSSLWFAWGWQNIVVTSVAGYMDPPRPARAVALSLVQNLWQESQQASHPLLDESVAAEFLPGAVAGLPEPLRNAYNKLRAAGIA